jgi:hypothetical protein
LWEKPVYSIVFECTKCEVRIGAKRKIFDYFGGNVKCPGCGTEKLERKRKRDKIDRLIKTPISVFQSLIGGNLYHCGFCRIQFYDVRRIQPQRSSHRASAAD